MTAHDLILTLETERAEKNYADSLERVKRHVTYASVRDLIFKMLLSPELDSAMGSLSSDGYRDSVEHPIDRIAFVAYFVGHEILDDGDPGVCWHKYGGGMCSTTMLLCDPGDIRGQPFFFRNRDRLAVDGVSELECLTAEKALWVLDWHEKRREKVIANMRKRDRYDEELNERYEIDVRRYAALETLVKELKEIPVAD